MGKTPGLVVWGFALSLLGFCGITAVIGLVLSLVGRKEAKAAGRGVGLNLAAIVIAGLWLLMFALSMVGGALSGPSTSTTASTPSANPAASASVEETKEPIATPSATPSEQECSRWEAYAQGSAKAGNKPGVDAAMKSAKRLGCKFARPKLIKPAKVYPTIDGIAYQWADNPDCGYFGCFGMTVRADDADCPNGFYAEINLLDASGTIVGYSNDTVGSLRTGQKAKLIFDITDDGVKSARISEFSCY